MDWRCSSRGSAGEFPGALAVDRSGVAISTANTTGNRRGASGSRCPVGQLPVHHGPWGTIGRHVPISIKLKGSLLGLARRGTLICCLKTRIWISASSSARGRNRSTTILKISLYNSNIEQQHRPILDQPPVDWIYDRDRQDSGRWTGHATCICSRQKTRKSRKANASFGRS